jgi:hypothetical protein
MENVTNLGGNDYVATQIKVQNDGKMVAIVP